jgi:hypothetical protein
LFFVYWIWKKAYKKHPTQAKPMKDLKYLLAYSIPLSAWLALQWQGWWSWATVILAFGIFPLLDAITSGINCQLLGKR